ncbi:MAG: phospho-sugar mutase [Planctomycetes bacterium]|nr:phospho-sugar mutase [Planctomycetota bacterium]MBL6910293.1 phospho-sugar mutase [Pirellulales bacterium]
MSADLVTDCLARLDEAHQNGVITDHSVETMRSWLREPRYAEFAEQLADLIVRAKADQEIWKSLDDAYWTVIPFGTGGRRGKMFPVGSNAINDRTIGESAQGLAEYVMATRAKGSEPSCTIAYDTRHRSEHFAKLCSEILLAAGFKIFFLRGYRSTPELSYAVRYTESTCGIMVTASHNPPSDNAVKVYWSGGVQVLPPHDKGIIERVMQVNEISRFPFDDGVENGRVVFMEDEIDPAFVRAVLKQATPGSRDLSVVYTPLHGVGATAVLPVLQGAGFQNVRLYGPQAEPNGDFPNVPGHVANPENPEVLTGAIEEARNRSDDVVMASDPDCDRLGAAAALAPKKDSDWKTFTGNQLGALLAEWVLETKRQQNVLQPTDTIVTTLVTSGLVRHIGEKYGLSVIDGLQVGFKWIGRTIDDIGPEHFVFGCEESHGYLAGTHVRDKDASVAALLLAELAAELKAQGRTLHQKLDDLFCIHGCHLERQVAIKLPGAAGMDRMREIMAGLRANPPTELGGLAVRRTRDYGQLKVHDPEQGEMPLKGEQGDLVIFDLLDPEGTGAKASGPLFPPLGNAVAARPSGTEPKIKFYLFAVSQPMSAEALPAVKAALERRLNLLEEDLRSRVGV